MQTYSSKDPKLILAVPATLSHGPSRALFAEFAEIPDNVVLLTGQSEPGTLGRQLFDRWNDLQRAEAKWDRGKIGSNIMMDDVLRLKVRSFVPYTNIVFAQTHGSLAALDPLENPASRCRTGGVSGQRARGTGEGGGPPSRTRPKTARARGRRGRE